LETRDYIRRYADLLEKLDVVERHRKLATYDLPQRIVDDIGRELERRKHVDIVTRAFVPAPLPTELTGGKLVDAALGFWGDDGAPTEKASKRDAVLDKAFGRGESK
jgi:hypothetical protein